MHKTELSCQALLPRAASVTQGVMTEEMKQNFNTIASQLRLGSNSSNGRLLGWVFQETYFQDKFMR